MSLTKNVFSIALLSLTTSLAAQAVELCHVANAGFLIKGENASVLVDGLMQEDVYEGRFALPSSDMYDEMINKTGLFKDLKLILSTHRHADHFDPKATVEHLRATNDVRYGITAEALKTLEANGLQDSDRERLFVVEDGTQSTYSHGGIDIRTFDVDHGPNAPQNVGYLVTVDDVSFFHTGDINTSREQLAEAGVTNLEVDALIIPFWFGLRDVNQLKTISESWKVGTMVPTHFHAIHQPWMNQFGGLDGLKQSIAETFEGALISTEEGECTPIG